MHFANYTVLAAVLFTTFKGVLNPNFRPFSFEFRLHEKEKKLDFLK